MHCRCQRTMSQYVWQSHDSSHKEFIWSDPHKVAPRLIWRSWSLVARYPVQYNSGLISKTFLGILKNAFQKAFFKIPLNKWIKLWIFADSRRLWGSTSAEAHKPQPAKKAWNYRIYEIESAIHIPRLHAMCICRIDARICIYASHTVFSISTFLVAY